MPLYFKILKLASDTNFFAPYQTYPIAPWTFFTSWIAAAVLFAVRNWELNSLICNFAWKTSRVPEFCSRLIGITFV
ncbi:hypothetical protein D6D54_03805 [Spiroplasma poulsonii]|uniref:Uncharacterized protein n=1 Tax=Spiroplasma poulsonii TaxID=2138 RepID=A0A433ER88_9MOLU|nr:hypothetical protein [Spiroplasma poulsonii]RUP77100.1 hypothetical protein D6D54_03805 [Spiroplasma poulsonii]